MYHIERGPSVSHVPHDQDYSRSDETHGLHLVELQQEFLVLEENDHERDGDDQNLDHRAQVPDVAEPAVVRLREVAPITDGDGDGRQYPRCESGGHAASNHQAKIPDHAHRKDDDTQGRRNVLHCVPFSPDRRSKSQYQISECIISCLLYYVKYYRYSKILMK